MRKSVFFVIIFLFILVLFLGGCNENDPDEGITDNYPTSLSLSIINYHMEIGEVITLEPVVSDTTEQYDFLFCSENPEIVTVDESGNITAVNEGETTITISLADYPELTAIIKVFVNAVVPDETLTLVGPGVMFALQSVTLIAYDYYSQDNKVIWESRTPDILKVDQEGMVVGLKKGVGIIRIISLVNAEWVEKEIEVFTPEPESVEIKDITRRITYSSNIRLDATVYPVGAKQAVSWSSENEDICRIDEEGNLIPIMPGEVLIKATVAGTAIIGVMSIRVEPTLLEVLEHYHNEQPLVQTIKVFGKPNYDHKLIGSVNAYLNADLIITESILSANLPNRPGNIQTATKYITVHDTGNSSSGANAAMHNNFIKSANVSWHYTVGNDGIYHHIPDNEIAWHAGDGTTVPYESFDSGIPYTNEKKPQVTITADGFYALDGIKSRVAAPRRTGNVIAKTSDINDLGIEVTKGENGNWFIGKTWYSDTFKRIGNRGGNLNSIGIESCVNKGSDIFLTWQFLAKLVAKLLEETGLGFDKVVQHHYFSGKDCPMTMRHSNNFPMFMRMVEVEYIIRTYYKNYTIEYISESPHIDSRGRITGLPLTPTRAGYTIKVTDNKTKRVEQRTLYVNLPVA